MSRVNKIMVIQCKKRETVKFKLIKLYSILFLIPGMIIHYAICSPTAAIRRLIGHTHIHKQGCHWSGKSQEILKFVRNLEFC